MIMAAPRPEIKHQAKDSPSAKKTFAIDKPSSSLQCEHFFLPLTLNSRSLPPWGAAEPSGLRGGTWGPGRPLMPADGAGGPGGISLQSETELFPVIRNEKVSQDSPLKVGRHRRLLSEVGVHILVQGGRILLLLLLLLLLLALMPVRRVMLLRLLDDRHATDIIAVFINGTLLRQAGCRRRRGRHRGHVVSRLLLRDPPLFGLLN